jgi:hypothetical protein
MNAEKPNRLGLVCRSRRNDVFGESHTFGSSLAFDDCPPLTILRRRCPTNFASMLVCGLVAHYNATELPSEGMRLC